MIGEDIWRDPAFANDIAAFRTNVRRYWKANVKKYFSKREAEYGLPPKLNHRFMISPYNEGREPRIQNALVVNWTPDSGHITIDVAPIMVKATGEGSVYKPERISHPTRTSERSYRAGQRAFDLISILSRGTDRSPGRYIASIDRRMPSGFRRATGHEKWDEWMSSFITKVDLELERLADKIEGKVANQLVEEI